MVLQDAIEAVFYAILIELGIDESKSLERKGFDELIGELKAADIPVPKSGTLKAMSKQRVLTKHYAQVAEPITVRNYLSAARTTIEVMTQRVLGRTIYDLFIADILSNGEAKNYLKLAERAVSQTRFLDALVEIRRQYWLSSRRIITFLDGGNMMGRLRTVFCRPCFQADGGHHTGLAGRIGSRRTFMSQLTISKSTTKIGDFKPWS